MTTVHLAIEHLLVNKVKTNGGKQFLPFFQSPKSTLLVVHVCPITIVIGFFGVFSDNHVLPSNSMSVAQELYCVVSCMMQYITEQDEIETIALIIQLRASKLLHRKFRMRSHNDITQFEVGRIKDFGKIQAHRPFVSSNVQP